MIPTIGTRSRAWRRGATLVVLLGALWLVRATVVVPVRIDSASMVGTYAEGDVVLVSRHPPDLADVARGDVVVFRSPADGRRTLKRVVGLGGDVLVVRDGELYVDEVAVPEPYVDHELVDGYFSATFAVPQGSLFVMGDNRGNSVDSRDYGPVEASLLLGRPVVRLWPLRR